LGKLRVLSGRQVCEILEAEGFSAVRQRGSHIVMQKRTDDTTTTAKNSLRELDLVSIEHKTGIRVVHPLDF